MHRQSILLHILLFLIVSQVTAYNTYKNVIIADDSNFENVIHEKGKYTFVNFYSKQCIHCSKLGPKFQLLTELFNGTKVQIAQLEGRENKRIRKQLSINGFPTLRLYAFDGTHLGSYNGDRSTEDMANFIQLNTGVTPNWPDLKVGELYTEKELKMAINNKSGLGNQKENNYNDHVVICFIAPWLENWIGRYSFIENLAKNLPQVDFYKIDATQEESSELTSLFKIDKFPTFLHFKSKNGLNNFTILENAKNIDQETFEKFLENEIGDHYDSLKDLELVKGQLAKESDQQVLKKGFNVGLQRKLSPEQEEESYRRLREL